MKDKLWWLPGRSWCAHGAWNRGWSPRREAQPPPEPWTWAVVAWSVVTRVIGRLICEHDSVIILDDGVWFRGRRYNPVLIPLMSLETAPLWGGRERRPCLLSRPPHIAHPSPNLHLLKHMSTSSSTHPSSTLPCGNIPPQPLHNVYTLKLTPHHQVSILHPICSSIPYPIPMTQNIVLSTLLLPHDHNSCYSPLPDIVSILRRSKVNLEALPRGWQVSKDSKDRMIPPFTPSLKIMRYNVSEIHQK